MAVADGHGGKEYERSNVGSQIATEVACEILLHHLGELDAERGKFVRGGAADELERQIPMLLCAEWTRRVKLDHELRKIREESTAGEAWFEVALSKGLSDLDPNWSEEVSLYGTTLSAVAVAPQLAIFVEIGDGCTLAKTLARPVHRVFEDHEANHHGLATDSLASRDGVRAMRVHVQSYKQDQLVAALLLTDGVTDSIARPPESVLRYFLSVVDREGWTEVARSLGAWLFDVSDRGVGDDATAALALWRKPATSGEPTDQPPATAVEAKERRRWRPSLLRRSNRQRKEA